MISKTVVLTQVNPTSYKLSLSRTGTQGAKGDSVSNLTIDSNNDLIVTIVDGANNFVEEINAGNITTNFNVDEISDVEITNIQDGQVIIYDVATSKYVNHSLTTSNITNIDETNRGEGSLLVYQNTQNKYVATSTLDNSSTNIIGGSF